MLKNKVLEVGILQHGGTIDLIKIVGTKTRISHSTNGGC